MLFDSHAHYTDDRFSNDVDEVLSSMQKNNVAYILNACSSMDEIPYILELSQKYPFLYASCGVHPHDVKNMTQNDLQILKDCAKNERIKAIGEIGLDYYYDNSPRDLQKHWFCEQIELAKEVNLPIIVHDRDAHQDTLDILKTHKANECGGVIHCYSASAEMAKDFLDLGFYIAFGGSVTFKNAKKTVEAAKCVPLERILIETDCPYLSPEPNRGKRNSSLYIHYVVEKLAEIKDISAYEIEKITCENAKKLFNID